nr:YetF domain-containing protein [Bacillus coahuilensis]
MLEVSIRSIFIIFGLFFITKLLGKKQLSKLSFFEYITGITVGDIAGTLSMEKELHLWEGVTSLLIWFFVPLFISVIGLHSPKFRHLVEGTPTVFIENGEVIEANLKKERYSTDELLEQLRKKGTFRVSDVNYASLDANGDLSIMLKKRNNPFCMKTYFN